MSRSGLPPGRRNTATLRKAITSDLVIRWNVKYADGTNHVIGTFTLPSTTALAHAVSFTTFAWDALPDLAVLIPDITASDGTKDKNGIAAWTVEWVGRGAGLPLAAGLGFLGPWDVATTYALNDITAAQTSFVIARPRSPSYRDSSAFQKPLGDVGQAGGADKRDDGVIDRAGIHV